MSENSRFEKDSRRVWSASPGGLFESLESSPSGISAEEAARRLGRFGPNELRSPDRVSPGAILRDQFSNVLIVILLVATALSAALGHVVEAVAITVIVVFAVVLGFVQEFRAERAIEALRRLTAPVARVLRGGSESEVPAREVVPGDMLVLRTGDIVPADARLIEAASLQARESALTGESLPVEKIAEVLPDEALALGDRRNMVFAGTAVTHGRALALVTATGMHTEFGKIAGLLHEVESRRTPLQVNLDRLGKSLARAAFVVVGMIVVLGVLRGQPFVEMLVFGIALAVAVVPEALPAVVTISLAMGVQRLVKRRALMRRLPAVETLGSTSVICSDKTGTLTKDEMTVRRVYAGGRSWSVSGAGYAPSGEFSSDDGGSPAPAPMELLGAAVLCSDATLVRPGGGDSWSVRGDPTEGALFVAAAKAGVVRDALSKRFPRVHEIPFTSESKRMTTLHRAPDGTLVAFAKGAPEVILASCARCRGEKGDVLLDEDARREILEAARLMAKSALRVLAVATREQAMPETASRDMTFLGLVGMLDPPRAEAREALKTCTEAGIRVVMITGDHPVTAEAVARELGLLRGGRVVTGTQLESMDESALERQVGDIDVYARVSPEHKLRVIAALQKRGDVVAMTGDGVNDAPALKKADIGVAMGVTGTDVAKESAAMTLTDDNFASIVSAVGEGRAIYGNIRKYLMYLLSSNLGEIGLMAGAALAGLPLPLTAVQILYVNLATDGLPALALAFDPPERDLMRRPPRDPRRGVFTPAVITLMVVGGVWSAFCTLGILVWALHSGRPEAEARTMTFAALAIIQFVKAYVFRSDTHSALVRPFANRWLNLAVLWEVALLVAVVNLVSLHPAFGIVLLPWWDWVILTAAAFSIVPVMEVAKFAVRRLKLADGEVRFRAG